MFFIRSLAILLIKCLSLNIKPYTLVVGVPAKQIGWMSAHGEKLNFPDERGGRQLFVSIRVKSK